MTLLEHDPDVMKLETFSAGARRRRYHYQSFEPASVNHEWVWEDAAINTLLESAARALAELNAFSLIVPDIDRFIEMHVVKEAQTSSRIEGTRTSIDEALLPEASIDPEHRDDWQEVRNYIDAMNRAIEALDRLPLSSRLLRDAHAILMRGARGASKLPGEFRVSQNWIGGSSLSDAAFIPPHADGVPDLMSDLERFWHNDAINVPHLLKAAISHYQFETIHPFLDGNGRIGRLLIPLYLVSQGVLARPSLYLSDFFDRNRTSYYDALARGRQPGGLTHWVRFFLQGVAETATRGRDVFRGILAMRDEIEPAVLSLGRRAPAARRALNRLYRTPIATPAELADDLGISAPAARAVIGDLVRLGVLVETTGRQRGRSYVFDRYLNLFLR